MFTRFVASATRFERAAEVSLRWKIALALATVSLIATTAVGVIGYRSTSDRLISEVDSSMNQAAALVVPRANGPIRIPDRGPLGVYEVQLIDRDGRVKATTLDSASPIDPAAARAAGHPGVVVRQSVTIAGDRFRVHTIGSPVGALQLIRPLDETERVLAGVRERTVLLVILVSLVAAGAGWLIANGVAKPLRRLTRAAEEVGASGQLDVEVDLPGTGDDEVGKLGAAFRGMLDALSRSRDAQQRLVQDAGHELRTPLTSLRTNLSVLRRHPDMSESTQERILEDLDIEVTELTTLVDELVAAASGTLIEEPSEEIALGPVAQSVATRVGRRRDREVTVELRSDPLVLAPPGGVDRALSNIIDNACKFDETDGPIEVVVADGGVRVLDHGPGIPEDQRDAVFARFHRTESARAKPGSGLGLSIVREIVEAHGGTVGIQSRPDAPTGADVGFRLPLA